ncbi:MAG TPA: hypothetical protein PKE31_04140 [Pseudomonadota bacterium]|nr:hypothetical protein [Pseudomonadota bacterium]
MLTSFVNGGTSAGVGKAFGNGPNGMNPYMFSAIKGGSSSAAGQTAANVLDPSMFSGRPEDIAKKWVTSVGGAGLSGSLDSIAETRAELKEAKKAQAQTPDQGPDKPKAEQNQGGDAGSEEGAHGDSKKGDKDDVSEVHKEVAAEKQKGKNEKAPEEAVKESKQQADQEKTRHEEAKQDDHPVKPKTEDTSKPTLGDETHDDKTTAVLTAADVSNAEGPKKLPPSANEVEKAVKWAMDKLDVLPKEGRLSREREAELFASGKISLEDHDKHQLEFNGMDAFVNSEAGKAAGLTSGSTPDEIIQAAHNHLRKLNESNYERVRSGEAEHPNDVSAERLKLAVQGNADGERVPLTYKGARGDVNDLAGATEQMRDFQGGLAAIADRNGITDMQVVQVGSGTTGWKNNPMKLLQHYGSGRNDEDWFQRGAWTPESDTDLAVFSDQAKVGAMQIDNPINADYGIFKTGSPDGKPGFSNTDLGGDLYRYGKEWDQRAYDPATLADPKNKDGLFDFKLNIGNDPFTTPPTLYTGPDRD